MTTPAREVATEKLLAYHRKLEEFQKAWAAEVGAWLAWCTLAQERGPSDPDVVELRAAWDSAAIRRQLAGRPLDIAGNAPSLAAQDLEREEVGHA